MKCMTTLITIGFFLLSQTICSQSNNSQLPTSINASGNAPDASSLLDVQSDDKGVLIPRMTDAQMIAIPSPATGLLIYNTNFDLFYYYDGTSWTGLNGSSGLETLNEGNGIGWRLRGRDPANYGNIGFNAVDLSLGNFATQTIGATGENSLATGYNTTASGPFSTALGTFTEAIGNSSTAIGRETIASGIFSTAMGVNTEASGDLSIAMGTLISAPSYAEIAIGVNNTSYAPNSTTSWIGSDRLFVVGNSIASNNRSDAFMILKNGTITAPSFDLSEITDNKALVTKEYVDINGPSGLEALNEGNGIGWRLRGRDPANYDNIGFNAVDLSFSNSTTQNKGASGQNSVAIGNQTIASGIFSTAMGNFSRALGAGSTATGDFTKASGIYSAAFGRQTEAIGEFSMAMGDFAYAGGNISTAMGAGTDASGDISTAMGG